jgi:hypothetical protein
LCARADTHTHTHIYIYSCVCVCVCVCVVFIVCKLHVNIHLSKYTMNDTVLCKYKVDDLTSIHQGCPLYVVLLAPLFYKCDNV